MLLKVKVIPNAKKNSIREESDVTRVYLTATPVKGKANKTLIEFLSGYYGVRRSNVRILRGEKSRYKILEITDKK